MKTAHFDCFSGASGDMILGALVGAGCDAGALESGLRKLAVSGWRLRVEKILKKGISATQVRVEIGEEKAHRSLSAILDLIGRADLPLRVRSQAADVFRRLGEAEGRIHAAPLEEIHFHEVGAVDAIVDIVGACLGLEMLGIERVTCSALNLGGGVARAAHAVLPVPAPATADLLRGVPTYSTGIERELVTPTGAAILTTLATQFGPQPRMRVAAIGYGAGEADLPEQANVLRLFVGQAAAEVDAAWDEEVVVVEANLDDMNPQIYGYFMERALQAGALDVFSAPVQMKKGRPGMLLTVLCREEGAEELIRLVFAETTTIGVRSHTVRRRCLARESVVVATSYGPVRIKRSSANGKVLHAAPEYEDCRKIASEKNVPLRQVFAEAMLVYERTAGKAS